MLTRREFIRRTFILSAGGALTACTPREILSTPSPLPSPQASAIPSAVNTNTIPTPAATMTAAPVPPASIESYLAVACGSNPTAITRAAIDALGGMSRFVKRGNDVIIKPNICNASFSPEYAATTNPDVVAALVTMCLESGAARVRVMDEPFGGTALAAYKKSGIRDAVEKAGGQMEILAPAKFVDVNFPNGRDIKKWKVYQDILKADVVINVPIAKVHDLAKLTLSMKGLMGIVADRGSIHNGINQRLADLATVIRPTLNVVDAVRILTNNGPTSWNLNDVVLANTVIATHDIVAADAYAAKTLFQKKPEEIGYIKLGAEMGLGRYDFDNLRIKQVTV